MNYLTGYDAWSFYYAQCVLVHINEDDPICFLRPMDTGDSEALFISCTALPALEIIEELENKINKTVLSSNQTLIWDSIRSIKCNSSIEGYGKLLRDN